MENTNYQESFITFQEIFQDELLKRIQEFRENKLEFKIALMPNINLPRNFYIYSNVALLSFDYGAEQTYTADSIDISEFKFNCIVAVFDEDIGDWKEVQIQVPISSIMFITKYINQKIPDKRGFKILHTGNEVIEL